MYVGVGQLSYQRSFGDSEDLPALWNGISDPAIYAFDQPDGKTRELSLKIRGSAAAMLEHLQNLRVLRQVSDQQIEEFRKHMQGVLLSYYPPNISKADSGEWFLEVVVAKQEFDDLLEAYRARRLTACCSALTLSCWFEMNQYSGAHIFPGITSCRAAGTR